MIISIIILLIVFLLIAIRQIGRVRLQIWQIMLGGAFLVLITKQITIIPALKSINLDVIIFLFGMFIVGVALEESGYLSHLSYKFFKRTKTEKSLLLSILFVMGIFSAFLMNDTIAIIGTPVMLLLAKNHKINAKMLLLALCFAVTIGSVMSPIGNPQNLLIAINGNINNPFLTFFKYFLFPTILNLIVAYLLIRLFYKQEFKMKNLVHSQEPIKDHNLALLSKISLILVFFLVIIKMISASLFPSFNFKLTYIAIISVLPILLFSKQRINIIKKIDWHTLIFFAAMFILMQSVWNSGFFQIILQKSNINIISIPMIFIVSIILSQFISNVPLVALYLPILIQAGASSKEVLALAAGSTIAGNLFILGAASNIIVIHNSEKKGKTLTSWEFARIGVPLTIINVLIYYFFLVII